MRAGLQRAGQAREPAASLAWRAAASRFRRDELFLQAAAGASDGEGLPRAGAWPEARCSRDGHGRIAEDSMGLEEYRGGVLLRKYFQGGSVYSCRYQISLPASLICVRKRHHTMQTKLQSLKDAAARQDWQSALRIAATFADLGEHKAAIVRGHEAHSNARFAKQLGRDPQGDIEAGILALCARYSLNRDGSPSLEPKAYSLRSNCIRAARKALGAEAKADRDFTLTATHAGWVWVRAEAPAPAPQAPIEAPAPVAEAPEVVLAPEKPARASSEAVIAKRRLMLSEADARGFSARWLGAMHAAAAGELPEAPDFSKPTHVSGRKWLAQAVALQAAGDIGGLRALVYDPEGSTGGALHRFVRFSITALKAKAPAHAR